jgi:peptide/nickel transport system substrate-binding protein
VLSDSPLYKPEYQESFAKLDLDLANKLLDEVGLDKKNDAGIRLLPDGREAEIIVETAGEDTNETDVLELVKESWAKAGIKLFVKSQTREVLDSRVASGDAMMSTWTGLENGVATADFPPYELAPTRDDQPHWPMWGLHTMTGGKGGVAIDEPNAAKLTELYWQWMGTGDADRRAAIWHEMLAIHADQVFTIGLVAAVPQPVVVSNKLKNVPEKGIYNFDPGAFFGIYHPDTFWLDAK